MKFLKITEENFIQEMKSGNEKSLDYVIDNYAWIIKTVLKNHLHYIPNYYEDCMNDCLLAIWENIDSYSPEISAFKNWVGGIAKYKAIDYKRKYLKEMKNKNIEDEIIPVEDKSLEKIISKEISEETEEMLNLLSPEDKNIFKKLYIEEFNMDEVSDKTGLTKSVIYNRISRGRKKIKNLFNLKGGKDSEKV